MADVREGLETGGEHVDGADLSDAQFNELLAEQVGKDKTNSPEERPARRDFSEDSAADIIYQVLSPEGNTDIRSGLSIHEPKPAEPVPEDWTKTPKGQEILRRGNEALDKDKADSEALAAYRFQEQIANGTTEGEILSALADLRHANPDGYQEAIWEFAKELSGVDPAENEDDADAMDWFAESLGELEAGVDKAEAQAKLERVNHILEGLVHESAKTNVAETKASVNEFAHEHGLKARDVAQVESFAVNVLGWDIAAAFAADPKQGRAMLETAWGTLTESEHAERERAVQQQILDAPGGSVRDGLEQLTPFGFRRINAAELPTPEIRPDRINARSSRKRVTGDDIRRAVTSPEAAAVQSGLTVAGRPATVDQVTGATQRHEEELRRRRARTEGFRR